MTVHVSPPSARPCRDTIPYAQASLLDLLVAYADGGDPEAWRELMSRKCLFIEGRWVTLAEFIAAKGGEPVIAACCGYDAVIVDTAIDFASGKFCNIRKQGPDAHSGPDPRRYFRALARRVRQLLKRTPGLNTVEQDRLVSRELRRFVVKHLFLSCKEACRQTSTFWSRYTITTPEGRLTVWLPRDIAGRSRAGWLAAHVGPVDPSAPGERDRVQQAIDRLVADRRIVSLSSFERELDELAAAEEKLPWSLEYGVTTEGLARTVSQEKTANWDNLRPSIRALGPQRVRELVDRIFTDLAADAYSPAAVAEAFGLSAPCLSRFAGPNWRRDGLNGVPDLYRNLAMVLSRHPALAEAARDAGIWDQVAAIVVHESEEVLP